MNSKTLLSAICILIMSCQYAESLKDKKNNKNAIVTGDKLNPYATIQDIPLPADFSRLPVDSNSFGAWLRKISLKKSKIVYLYNGDEKENQRSQCAVLNFSVGNKDLQQCADAVMRLKAEYLFEAKKFSEIIFFDNENGKYEFTEPYNKDHFYNYLEKVFGMCGTASLSKQLHKKNIDNIEPGDVLIRGGFPGHAAIVTDVAINKEGKRIFMLAQSYMPAQDIHVLINPLDEKLSPWYEIEDEIVSPEYVFTKNELKCW